MPYQLRTIPYGSEMAIGCPDCGDHMVDQAGFYGENVEPQFNASIIVIPFTCAYGHQFNLLIENHEGTQLISVIARV